MNGVQPKFFRLQNKDGDQPPTSARSLFPPPYLHLSAPTQVAFVCHILPLPPFLLPSTTGSPYRLNVGRPVVDKHHLVWLDPKLRSGTDEAGRVRLSEALWNNEVPVKPSRVLEGC